MVAALFLYFAYTHSTLKSKGDGYTLKARFDRIDGLLMGSEVRLSGVPVGTVSALKLDPQTYLAIVEFTVRSDIKLPSDSSAAVQTDGLLGDKYLSLTPGGEQEYLKSGDEVVDTQSALNLTDLIGRAIFSNKKDGEESSANETNDESEGTEEESAPSPQEHKETNSSSKS